MALFTEYSHHGYYPLAQIQDLCKVLEKRMTALRSIGIKSVGLNVLDTIGHIDEAWDVLEKPPFGTMMGHDGSVSRSCMCPNGEAYRKYIWEKYQLMAKTNPDFIWVDDDIRMHHHSVAYACFCPQCIDKFNRTNGTAYTREELVKAINSPDGGEWRKAWLEQNRFTIVELLEWIRKSVQEVNLNIQLGLMTCGVTWGNYSNPNYGEWMDALDATKGRPGGGFSDDDHPLDFVRKIFECARQIPLYSRKVTDIQYELENFPYQKLSKAVYTVILECTASLLVGHTGIAFNALSFDDNFPLLDAIRKQKGMWETIRRLSENSVNVGLYPCFSLEHAEKRTVREGDWFNSSYAQKVDQAYELAKIGIPLTMDEKGASANILIGTMPEAYTDEALKKMLTQGVMMDGQALEILLRRGMGSYCGVEIERIIDNGVYERMYDHPFNGVAANGKRDVYITFWGDDSRCYVLKKTAPETQFISGLETIQGVPVGPCLSLYENDLGGRVAVCGFMPWRFIGSMEKRHQLNEICNWICGSRMPVCIRECVKVVPFMRKASDGKSALLMLVNGSLDETGKIRILLDAKGEINVSELQKNGDMTPCKTVKEAIADQTEVEIENMKSWEFKVLYIEYL